MLTAMTAAKNGFMCNSSIFMASGSHIPLGSIRSNDKILSSSFKITSIKRISKYKANIFLEVKF